MDIVTVKEGRSIRSAQRRLSVSCFWLETRGVQRGEGLEARGVQRGEGKL